MDSEPFVYNPSLKARHGGLKPITNGARERSHWQHLKNIVGNSHFDLSK